jgi:hypothetical protein
MESPKTSKVVVRKGTTYLIPPTSLYYANLSSLFAQYEKPRCISKSPQSTPSHSLPSTNPFDGLEVEEYTIVSTKYKKPPRPQKQLLSILSPLTQSPSKQQFLKRV